MYTFISPKGEKVKVKSIKAFAETYQFNYQSAVQLTGGFRSRIKGWCSTHPKAKKEREKFLTVLVNTRTGERDILGQSVTGFAERHNLHHDQVHQLVSKHLLCYKGWVLEKTYNKFFKSIADSKI